MRDTDSVQKAIGIHSAVFALHWEKVIGFLDLRFEDGAELFPQVHME